MRSKDFLRHYASQFQAVEIDSTFYGTPAASTVTNWNEKTPGDFIFASKVPQVITHEKVLVDCEPEFDEFIERMHLLGNKLGPMLLQFPKFDKWVLKSPDEFHSRLASFFKRVADVKAEALDADLKRSAAATEQMLKESFETEGALHGVLDSGDFALSEFFPARRVAFEWGPKCHGGQAMRKPWRSGKVRSN